MPERETIQTQIIHLFSEKLNLEISSVETDLLETGILDSLKFVELLVELERLLGRQVSLDGLEVENFRSIQKIAEFVASQNGRGGTA